MKLSYAIDKDGILNGKKTCEDYHDTERLLKTFENFKLKDGEADNGNSPLHGKDNFLME